MRDDNDPFTEKPASPGELLSELDSIKGLLDEELEQRRAKPATAIEEIGSVEEYLRVKQLANDAGLSIEAYLESQSEESEAEAEPELLEDENDLIPLLDEIVTLDDDDGDIESHPAGDALLMELAEEEQHAPSTSEATTVEEYFAAVVAAKHHQHSKSAESTTVHTPAPPVTAEEEIPLLDEVFIQEEHSLLDQVMTADEAVPLLDEVVLDDETMPLLDEVILDDGTIPLLADIVTDNENEPDQQSITLDDMHELVDLIVNRKLQHLKPELEKEVMAELQKLLPPSTLTKS